MGTVPPHSTRRTRFRSDAQERAHIQFPNKAGDHADTDEILRAELAAAGIQNLLDTMPEGGRSEMAGILRNGCREEVKTSVIGLLHGWTFKRAWYHWVCSGPGIPIEAAEKLHLARGKTVRVDGDADCQSPRKRFHGLACGHYHVDDADGLKALADTIKSLVAAGGQPAEDPEDAQEWEAAIELARKDPRISDGDLEIDDDAVVSFGGDNGAYVQAWLWVSFEGTPLDKETADGEDSEA